MSPDATDELLSRIADRLKALSDANRLKILHLLEDRELNVTEILAEVGGSQANVSKHLARMRLAGLVAARRDGPNVFYRVIDPTAFAICRTVCDALEQRADQERQVVRGGRRTSGVRR